MDACRQGVGDQAIGCAEVNLVRLGFWVARIADVNSDANPAVRAPFQVAKTFRLEELLSQSS
ncbi:hypothetical protein D3C85_1637940 [compost metagenome]